MPDLISKIYFAVIISCLALVTVGCGARDTGEDIPPVISVEAQAMTKVTKKPEPTPMAEIVEPISPVSPISPTEETIMMSPIHKNVEPIKGSEEALTAAIADLVEQTGVSADEITLVGSCGVERCQPGLSPGRFYVCPGDYPWLLDHPGDPGAAVQISHRPDQECSSVSEIRHLPFKKLPFY